MSPRTSRQVMDPVCRMWIDPSTAAGRHVYHGSTFYFCSPGCLDWFAADPEKYVGEAAEQEAFDRHHASDPSDDDVSAAET